MRRLAGAVVGRGVGMWWVWVTDATAAAGETRVQARLEHARERRDEIQRDQARVLLAAADAVLSDDLLALDASRAEEQFAYRDLKGKVALWWATSLLVPSSPLPVGPLTVRTEDQAAYVEWMLLYANNTLALNREIRAWAGRREGTPWSAWSALPADDQQRANALLGMGWEATGRFDNSTHVYAEELVNTVCLGRWRNLYIWKQGVSAQPTLLELDPQLTAAVLRELERATDDALGTLWLTQDAGMLREMRALELYAVHGDCLAALGRRDDALRHWQRGLDRFPTAMGYEAVEARIRAHAP